MTLTLDQAMTVIERTRGDWLHPLWVLFLTTGAREAEALGLTWDDVDLVAGKATIGATLHRTGTRGSRGSGGRRRRAARAACRWARWPWPRWPSRRRFADVRQPDWRYFGLVFLPSTGSPGTARRPAALVRDAGGPGAAAGARSRLRHTAASLMLSLGYGLEDVKQILGHSTIRVTSDTYRHPVEARKRLVAEGLDEALGGHGDARPRRRG